MASSSYRPHNPGHDYYEAGAYLITLVVGERERILSSLNDDAKQPGVVLSQVGRIVHEEWEKTEAIQCGRGRLIETRCQVCKKSLLARFGNLRGSALMLAAMALCSSWHHGISMRWVL